MDWGNTVEEKMQITAYEVIEGPMALQAAERTRKWMDESVDRFAYRCLPVAIANQLPDILNELPLAAESKNALTDYSGVLGDSLRNVLDYERGHWDRLDVAAGATYKYAYLEALQWCHNSQHTLH